MKIIEGTITEINQPKKNFWGAWFIKLKIDGKSVKIRRHDRILFSCLMNSRVDDKVTIKLNFRRRIRGFTTNSARVGSMF